MKRLSALLLMTCLLSSLLVSCRQEKEHDIQFFYQNDKYGRIYVHTVIYQETVYKRVPYELIRADTRKIQNPIVLREAGIFSSYGAVTFAPTADSSFFLYCRVDPPAYERLETFVREDYDYRSDIFVLEGTDYRAPLAEIIDIDSIQGPFREIETEIGNYRASLVFRSQTHAELICKPELYDAGKQWRLHFGDSTQNYTVPVSDELLSVLKKNGILRYEFIEN